MLFRNVPVVFLCLCAPLFSQTQLAQTYPLNGYVSVLEGQWQGIHYASDGNVYFASSTHSVRHGAAFFKYDPRTRSVTMLAEDITRICGEDPRTNPQGKIHSDIVEANGWLYFSTHFSMEALPGALNTWSGSHVVGYELATGRFRDYGVVHPNHTSYTALTVDPVRKYIYVFVTGMRAGQVSYVYRIDATTGTKTNLGQVGSTYGTNLWFFLDKRGDVWFALYNDNGTLRRIQAATGKIDVYPNAMPPMYRAESETMVSAPGRGVVWMKALDGDRALFTLGPAGGMLYMFDSSQPIGSGREFRNVRHIGYTDLGLALANNRLYYYQRANRGIGHQEARDFHLLSMSLDASTGYAIIDHGLLADAAGRLLWRAPSMTSDGNSRVFLVGDWWTLPGDAVSQRYAYENGADVYYPLPRAQFFAAIDVTFRPKDETAPTVSIASPAPGAKVSGTVTLAANARDNNAVAGVQFFLNGSRLGSEVTSAPYSTVWNTTGAKAGSYSITATARDSDGNSATSSPVLVDVPDTAAPTVSITAPSAGSVTGMVNIVAAASDDVGVAGVQFKLNGANLGAEVKAAPFALPWNTASVASGVYTLTAVARDAAGNQKASAAVSVTVGGDTVKPAISFLAPAQRARFSSTMAVTATATDNVGITLVQLYLDGQKIGPEFKAAPYTVNVDVSKMPLGGHVLTATARDAAGNVGSAAPVTVIVEDITPPTVVFTNPTAGATVGGWVTLSVNATDDRGIAGVEFFFEGQSLGPEVKSPPYQKTITVKNVSNWRWSFQARARDVGGNRKLASVTVNVRN